jgi:Flp pilus assembly protein TadG
MPSSTGSDRARARRDVGQATVELALCLPFLCLLLLGTVQVALVIRDQLVAGLAAREAARAAAVSADPVGAGVRAALSGGLDADRAEIAISDDGTDVVAAIAYRVPTDLPLIGLLLPDLMVRASATMAFEPP